MITIQNYLDVKTLWLTWQSNRERNRRFLVGIVKKDEAVGYSFSYLTESKDFLAAREAGFEGFPAFKISDHKYTNDVLSSFRKRLPPKSRRDFNKYLEQHNLPSSFSGDDFQLISHTGIQLPSDGFDIIPDLPEASIPFDYMMEVAGTRYQEVSNDIAGIQIGEETKFLCEYDNPHDPQAIAIYWKGKKIGFSNRLLCRSVRKLMNHKSLTCRIAKKSGTPERPLIFILLSVN